MFKNFFWICSFNTWIVKWSQLRNWDKPFETININQETSFVCLSWSYCHHFTWIKVRVQSVKWFNLICSFKRKDQKSSFNRISKNHNINSLPCFKSRKINWVPKFFWYYKTSKLVIYVYENIFLLDFFNRSSNHFSFFWILDFWWFFKQLCKQSHVSLCCHNHRILKNKVTKSLLSERNHCDSFLSQIIFSWLKRIYNSENFFKNRDFCKAKIYTKICSKYLKPQKYIKYRCSVKSFLRVFSLSIGECDTIILSQIIYYIFLWILYLNLRYSWDFL